MQAGAREYLIRNVLSLFFIDAVEKYRQYDAEGNPVKGDYARIFEEEYRRLAKRRGDKKAIVAVAHSILVAAWHILRDGVDYRELGGEYFDRVQRDHLVRYYQRRLAELGVNALIVEAAAS